MGTLARGPSRGDSRMVGSTLGDRDTTPVDSGLLDIVGLGLLSLAGYWVARYGVLSLRANRSNATNLVATRVGLEPPIMWLVAHIDSKSQTIPMIARVASAVAFAISSAAALLGILLLGAFGRNAALSTATMAASYIAAATALPIILCFIVGNKSRGALDNATGVASIILAAEKLGPMTNIGVLITSAEELGLAGARHFVSTQIERGIAINCDTIDDAGKFLCMASGRKIQRLDAAIDSASSRLQIENDGNARQSQTSGPSTARNDSRHLADNVAFTDGGWESFTLSRGNIATLGYVHTSRDMPDRIQGTGIAKAASLIAAIVEELG